jgi:hypothetical protein
MSLPLYAGCQCHLGTPQIAHALQGGSTGPSISRFSTLTCQPLIGLNERVLERFAVYSFPPLNRPPFSHSSCDPLTVGTG